MDGKLILTEKEIPASYAYDYADREGFTHPLKMHTLGHSSDLSNYAALLSRSLKDFTYWEGKVWRLSLSFPKFLPVVFTIGNFCEI
jgi:hypothetical protein